MSSRLVLVTGGGRGVGRGISERFLADGCDVVICGREAPAELLQGGGRKATFVKCDVRDAAARDALFAELQSRFGRLDVLISNAGGSPYALADQASPRFHESILQLNLLAPLHLAQKANAMMQAQKGGGAIVFVASVSGLRASPGTAAYGAAKAGLINLAQSLAVEWAPKVRVACISPGPVETEQSELHYGDAAGVAAVAKTIPAGRLAQPADVAAACAWLCSAEAAYVSGTNLVLHGGGERPAFLDAAKANKR